MYLFSIETSCDETAAALLKIEKGKLKILSNVVSSQIKIHKKYGGIVPEVAARCHIENIIPIIDEALLPLGKENLKNLDAFAVTIGPGLITSLLVGVKTAQTLAFALQKPLIPINHLEGHIYANFLTHPNLFTLKNLFPTICLIVSGGHTELILMKNHGIYQKIGETLDDAVGEAFDKVAKLLGLGYPGGPAIAAEAAKFSISHFQFLPKLPKPMINSQDFNFSFSGLKTAVLYTLKNQSSRLKNKKSEIAREMKRLPQKIRSERKRLTMALAHEFQKVVVEVLIKKTIKAVEKFGTKTVFLCGGVAANSLLREELKKEMEKLKINFFVPEKKLCTDNAAMIACAAYFKIKHQGLKNYPWQKIKVDPNLEL